MQPEQDCTMVVHDIRVDGDEVTVGATTRWRWNREVEQGYEDRVSSAYTLVWVELHDHGPGYTVSERIGLSPPRDSVERAPCLAVIPTLLDTAWEVKNQGWNRDEAIAKDAGRVLTPTSTQE
jgi:hypothetical protein